MKFRSNLSAVIFGLFLCLMGAPVVAQVTPVSEQINNMPQALQLKAVPGSKDSVYQDAFGRTYTVNPQSGGSLCDPQGCMVQVCTGGACTYYYCTHIKCQQISPQAVIVPKKVG
jgi:hypothetical protein